MAKTLRNTVLALMAVGTLLFVPKAQAQTQATIGAGGQDTVWMKSADGKDSAKSVYWSRDGTNELGAVEINNVLYIAESPKLHNDSSTVFKTRKAPGKNYGYDILVDEVSDGAIYLRLKGINNAPVPEPDGKELQVAVNLTNGIGTDTTWDGTKMRIEKIRGPPSLLDLTINNEKKLLTESEWKKYANGDEYKTNFGFSGGDYAVGRVVKKEPTTLIRRSNLSYNLIPENENGTIFDISGKKLYSGPNPNEIVRKVMSQNPCGTYIVRLPNGKTLLERKLK